MGNIQASFTSGELAPSLYGRLDFAKYYTGLKTCRNFIVRQSGGVSNRTGTRLVDEAGDSSKRSRLIPFEFSTTQAYVLEFGHLYMRIIKDGGLVVYPVGHPSAGQIVTVVTPYSSSNLRVLTDIDLIRYVQSSDVMTLCLSTYPTQQLSRTDHHLWSLAAFDNVEGPFQEINIDETKTLHTSDVTGSVNITADVAIFTEDMVGQMFYIEQSPDALTKKWEVEKLVYLNDIRRAGPNYYRCLTSEATYTGTVRPDHTEGIAQDGDPGVTWLYLHSGYGIVLLTGFTSDKIMTGTVMKRLPDLLVTGSSSKEITDAVVDSGGLDPGDETVIVECLAHEFVTGTSVTITGVTGMTDINGTFVITVIDPNHFRLSINTAQTYTSGGTATATFNAQPTYKWALEAWGGDQGYPSVTTYHQQRQLFAASTGKPQDIWMSRTAGYTNFGTSSPVLDDDAINVTINSRRATGIRHFVELSDLIALTTDGPFLVRGAGDNGVIAPGKITLKRQGSSGASIVPPVVVNNHALYVQELGSQVRSLGYDFANDAFIGSDLTILSNHFFKNRKIVEWAYQAVPFSCIWCVCDDGALLGFTYMPEHEVAGWHRHDTDGFYESVCVIPEGNEDVVYFVVRRTLNGVTKRYIERMASRNFASASDYFFVDCGLTYNGAPADTISGLDHLEGETVAILADGHVHPNRVVTGGSIQLEYEASVVHVGLPIVADFETLDLSVPQSDIRDKKKVINHVAMIVEETRGVFVGPDPDHLIEIKPRSTENYTDPASAVNGLMETTIPCNWSNGGRIFSRQSLPLPITILAVIPEVTAVGGSR